MHLQPDLVVSVGGDGTFLNAGYSLARPGAAMAVANGTDNASLTSFNIGTPHTCKLPTGVGSDFLAQGVPAAPWSQLIAIVCPLPQSQSLAFAASTSNIGRICV